MLKSEFMQAAAVAFCLGSFTAPAWAGDQGAGWYGDGASSGSGQTQTAQTPASKENPLYLKECKCKAMLPPDAPPPPKTGKKKHKVLAGLGKEMAMEMGDLGKDMFIAFSVSGKDPYEMPSNPNIPYVAAEAQFIDGESSHLYKYPDGSYRMQGGFLDATFACQQEDGSYIIQYPTGARGTVQKTGDGVVIKRPDNTTTTVTEVGQSYRIVNSKLGYMGDITPDKTGLSYEFAKQNF